MVDRFAAGRPRRRGRWRQLPRRQRLVPDRRAAGHRGLLAGAGAPRALTTGSPKSTTPSTSWPRRGGAMPASPGRAAARIVDPSAAAPPRRARAPRPVRRALSPHRRTSAAGRRGAGRGIERRRCRDRDRDGRRRAGHRARRTRRRERSGSRGSAHRSPRPAAHGGADTLPALRPAAAAPHHAKAAAPPADGGGRPGLPPRRRRARLRHARELRRPDRCPAQPVDAGAAGRHRQRRALPPTPSRSPSTTATPKPCATRSRC